MNKNHKRKNTTNINSLKKQFIAKTLKFTEKVIVCVTLLYVFNWFVSVCLICLAIKETANFAYLDTLITETSTTFRDIVGIAIIKFGVENIFKYNDFGGKVPSNGNYTENSEEIPTDDVNDIEIINLGEDNGGING